MRAGIRIIATATCLTAALGIACGQEPIAPGELVAPQIDISGGNVNLTVQPSVNGRKYQLQAAETLATGSWQNLGDVVIGNGNNLLITTPHLPGTPRRFYRLALDPGPQVPDGFALIPAGEFLMGRTSGDTDSDAPPVNVYVSGFYMGKYEVTKELWDAVRASAANNGYTDLGVGGGKGPQHPVHTVSWWDVVKWCNARSEMEGLVAVYRNSNGTVFKTGTTAPTPNWSANGYRLPTEAEWEKAARGGVSGKRFPWGTDTISHSQANFWNDGGESYQTGTTGPHPFWSNNDDGNYPYSSPVGSFASNGYGLYDMAGNMWEWCWDWYGGSTYVNGASDPKGASSGSYRVLRGGSWGLDAIHCRTAYRISNYPGNTYSSVGFRPARSSVP